MNDKQQDAEMFTFEDLEDAYKRGKESLEDDIELPMYLGFAIWFCAGFVVAMFLVEHKYIYFK